MKPSGDRDTDFVGKIMTTKGLMNPEKLDITLMHEHLFMELWLDKMSSPATSPMDAKLRE